jgi:biotin carboxyl carrier protein
MLSLRVNDTHDFSLDANNLDANIIELQTGVFSLIHHNQSYTIEIIEQNKAEKTATFRINGRTYTVQAENALDQLLKQLGMNGAAAKKINQIKAPMPGLILQILVTEGQTIAKGDALLILEAMKMENVIKSPGEGVIKSIAVAQGDSVEKNQILIAL